MFIQKFTLIAFYYETKRPEFITYLLNLYMSILFMTNIFYWINTGKISFLLQISEQILEKSFLSFLLSKKPRKKNIYKTKKKQNKKTVTGRWSCSTKSVSLFFQS